MASTIAELANVPRPQEPLPHRGRVAPHELAMYRVRAIVRAVRTEPDGDWHLILADPNDRQVTLIGEIPDSVCAVGSPFAAAFSAARRSLRQFGRGATVEVTGVGFFDHPHGQRGAAPNNFELHPIVAIDTVALPLDSAVVRPPGSKRF